MRTYLVELAGREITVSVRDGKVVAIAGETVEGMAIQQTDRNRYTVLLPGMALPLAVVRNGKRFDIAARGVRIQAEVRDERDRLRRKLPGAPGGPGKSEVRAPMPALVVRVEVKPGEAVKAGQTLVVLEAMKMENDVRASAAGTVESVAVAPGKAVEKDQVLLTVI